jgi:hypothetical protein
VGAREKAIALVERRIVGVEEASPYVRIMVYGRNGSGKTRFAASAPNVLIIDINEEGTRSARQFKGAKVFHVKKWEDITYAYWYLKAGNHSFESVALDNLTALGMLCMTQVLKEGEERDPNRDPKLPVQRDWNKVTELMKPVLLNFRNLPMHVVFVAQEREVEDEDGGIVEHVPNLSKANRAVATGAVDIIGRMYQKEVSKVNKRTKREEKRWETRMLVGPHDEYITKDRTNALGRIVREPNMPAVIEAAAESEES